jgi:hypothetical protein
MDRERRRESYLAHAKAADEKAEKATDSEAKERWRAIAESYRNLARHT